jgi:hypothetical protein
MFETFAIVIAGFLILLGLAGCILPFLPGPPLSFTGLLLLAVLKKFSPPLTSTLVIVMAIVMLGVTALDYFIPVLGARRYGASKWGIWGSVAGMLIGLFYPPFGMVFGAFLGAVAGEWLGRGGGREAWRAGWGAFVGILSGVILKLIASGLMTYYFVRALMS